MLLMVFEWVQSVWNGSATGGKKSNGWKSVGWSDLAGWLSVWLNEERVHREIRRGCSFALWLQLLGACSMVALWFVQSLSTNALWLPLQMLYGCLASLLMQIQASLRKGHLAVGRCSNLHSLNENPCTNGMPSNWFQYKCRQWREGNN